MNNLIIGIVARKEELNGIEYQVITNNNLKYLDQNINYIGILNYDDNSLINKKILDFCDGIIIPGGSNIYGYHFKIVEYCLNNHIPLLGICMGHQIIGLFINNQKEEDLVEICNHYGINKIHNIKINKKSVLFNIFEDNISVNSRHLFKLKKIKKPFIISAKSEDNVIEAIEYIDNNNFILGVQFHPEDLDNMKLLYDLFINKIKNKKKFFD